MASGGRLIGRLRGRKGSKVRLILLLAVIALGADALLYNGAYTQAIYHEITSRIQGQ